MTEFSIVVAAHNRQEFLLEALQSVEEQTLTDWEIIVVDDGSDPPISIPDQPKYLLVRHEIARGPGAARNTGIRSASGQYIAFLDDDDLFTPERLEIAREGLQRAPLAISWSRVAGEPLGNNLVLEGNVRHTILNHLTPSPGATAVRRNAALLFDEDFTGVEDVEWWLRMTKDCEVATVRRVGLLIRRWRSISEAARANQIRHRVQDNRELLQRHRSYFATHRVAAAFRLKRIGLMLMDLGEYRQAGRDFRHSFRLHPTPRTAYHVFRAFRFRYLPIGTP